MSIETSNFAITRGGTTYRILGQEIEDGELQENDVFVLQRGNDHLKFVVPSDFSADAILDDDLFVCTDFDDVTYKVTGEQFKELFGPPVPFETCISTKFLTYLDCVWGCDSAYCNEMCVKRFHIAVDDGCSPIPDWYNDEMLPFVVFLKSKGEDDAADTASSVVINSTVVTVSNGVFYLDGVAQPSLSLEQFEHIAFDQTDPSNVGHPLRIYEDEARTVEVTSGVQVENYDNGGLPDPETGGDDVRGLIFLALTPGTYYYQCANHAGMGGTITVTAL